MSAIIYRAPDSTGVGLFGDDREPIRQRKSLGSVVQLFETLRTEAVYSRPEALLRQALAKDAADLDLPGRQQLLLVFEGFAPRSGESPRDAPDIDALVNLESGRPTRLGPGAAGKALFPPEYRIRSRKNLSSLIQLLITSFDLSPLMIHTLIRGALAQTIDTRRSAGAISASNPDILAAFDDLFEATRVGARVKRLRGRAALHAHKPPGVLKQLWQCLLETEIRIPLDFNRDGVCCLFRLLDAALLSRMPGEPALAEELDRALDRMWPPSQRPVRVDWRNLYAAEKGLNVHGRASAAALAWLRETVFSRAGSADVGRDASEADESVAAGWTDPLLLRYLATPVMAHGRWAMQSAVTKKNAQPFMDALRRRTLALNGQFDSRVEARLRSFLEEVGGYRLRSDNSTEYAALLWGHFYDQLKEERRRGDLVRREVDNDMTDITISSQSIDYSVHLRVRDRAPEELDRMAFVAAARRIVRDGGQIAVVGMSLVSPLRLYVASHNRPVFIVRRLENEDFMVVSDINAALGLFPQVLIEKTIRELDELKKRRAAVIAKMAGEGADRILLRNSKLAFAEERERLLDPFAVEVHPLDGEEIFALIETVLTDGAVGRVATITDFDGAALPDLEPFETRLDPVTVRKDVDTSFFETHLREVPERYRYILDVFSPDAPGGGPVIDLKTRVLRRRFGRGLAGLRRLILVGAGSAFHMAVIARRLLADLTPGIAIDALRPGDMEDPGRSVQTQRDLVIMLSWSSTTAEMVQLAQRLLAADALLIGVTEKRFADMGLAAGKSAGVMPVFSGEEVTIAGVKSALCMLLCVHLLGAWICAEKGAAERLDPMFIRLNDLADRIERLNDDEETIAFSQKTAATMAAADAVVVVGAPGAAGVGMEMALKLEEAGWFAVGKWRSYNDILDADPSRWSPGRFIIVHATWRAHVDASIEVMEKLARAGVDFAVVTCPNRRRDRIRQLCGGRCLTLPWVDDESQPYLDLAFCYRLTLDVGFANGHGAGVAPRNRAKSSTITRSRPKTLLSPAAELKRLAETAPVSASADQADGKSSAFRWEDVVNEPEAVEAFAELRRLAEILRRDDPLAALGVQAEAGAARLGRLLFDDRSEVNEVVIAPLDPAAGGVMRDAAAVWRRLINLPIRETPPGEWPPQAADDALVLVAAAAVDRDAGVGDGPPAAEGLNIGWIGPEPPPWLSPKMAPAGRFILPSPHGRCPPARLYAALNVLFAKALARHAPKKAEIARRHIAGAADAVTTLLGDARLLAGAREIAAANARYRTAFFISPLAGVGRTWEERFDAAGRLIMVHHAPGHAAHGPIVTIDGAAADKYVAMEKRADMVARYGERDVARWEARRLSGGIDEFMARPPMGALLRPRTPFYADNQWRLPVVRPDYDTRHDNLIILDMTGEREAPMMLDELSLLGSRAARLVVITQEAR
ncbi:MAG: hypothetical protein GY856_45185, partial [bacterium]|nr:hypothetical protein [bacterium]